MKELLYWIVEWIAKIHSHILRLNDEYSYASFRRRMWL